MVQTITEGQVKADMGALTTAAEQAIRDKREMEEREHNEKSTIDV